MKNLFPALETKFDAVAALVAVGRKLVRSKQESAPHTLVETEPTDTLDTFDSNIEVYTVRFTYTGKRGIVATNADTWLTQMIATFDDTTLSSAAWTNCRTQRISKREPEVVDGRYQAGLEYEITVQLV
jgi:hypothetical protein